MEIRMETHNFTYSQSGSKIKPSPPYTLSTTYIKSDRQRHDYHISSESLSLETKYYTSTSKSNIYSKFVHGKNPAPTPKKTMPTTHSVR